jgi:protein SCO1/2
LRLRARASSGRSGYPPRVIPRASRPARLASLLAATAVALAGCGAGAPTPSVIMLDPASPQAAMGERDTAYSPVRPAPELKLTDQTGQPFDLASLHGTPVFVYFGYTHCPDICPTTLVDLRTAIKAANLPAKVVFVTVDPARDTPAAMQMYLDAYKAGFIGLTGTDAQIAAAAAAWGVSYRAEPADSAGNYAMSHTTDVYLVDGQGMLRNHIFFGAGTQLIDDLLRQASG